MSSIPARSRSLRKPVVGVNKQDGRPSTGVSGPSKTPNAIEIPRSASPSKIKAPGTGHVRTRSTTTTKISTTTASNVPRPPRSITTRPPISTDNAKPISLRSKTPDAPTSNTTSSIQRQNSVTSSTSSAASSLQRQNSISVSNRPVRGGSVSTTNTISNRPVRGASVSTVSTSARAAPSHSRGKSTTTASIRPSAQSTILQAPTASTILRPPSSSSSVTASLASTSMPPPPRPTFTTLQQHFSPAKGAALAPKPASATFYAPPSPSKLPSNIAISAETARLQAELLQLHLLHRDAGTVNAAWRESAYHGIKSKFEHLRVRNDGLANEESRESERRNMVGWKHWNNGGVPGWGLEEHVQALDEVLSGAWKLSEAGSRYSKCVKRFERWLDGAEEVMSARARSGGDSEEDAARLAALDAAWRTECEGLERKVGGWRAQMRELDSVGATGSSALADTVEGCRSLARGMHEQLRGMLRVEEEVRRQDREWISRMCDEDSDDDGGSGRAVGGAWRR